MSSKIKAGSFADGIRKLNTRGEGVIPGIRLTKTRAQILIRFIERYKYEWNTTHEESESDNDMQAAMQWVANKIYKRWSQNEIYSIITLSK